MPANDYPGIYTYMGLGLYVNYDDDGTLLAAVPGVPPGYEIVLERVVPNPEGDSVIDTFINRGGPLDGETAVFERDAAGEIIALATGGMELSKVSAEQAADLRITAQLPAPPFDLTPEKEAAFAALFASVMETADGRAIDYQLPYPRHEFIQYVMARDTIIFHGTGDPDIDTFAPIRKSVELRDQTGRGNVQGVYGTHDGLWSMFFAVVDRPNLKGSIRNGVMTFHNRAGDEVSVYNFSINQDQLADQPWRTGTLYFLPRDTFTRLMLTPTTFANEWASEQPVRPIARLTVRPEDFPFLDRIGGHDDSELLRYSELGKLIHESTVRATLSDEAFTQVLPAALAPQVDEYLGLQAIYMPAVVAAADVDGDELTLTLTSLPPAYRQTIKDGYANLLIKG